MKVQDAVREIRLPHELFETRAQALDERMQRVLQTSKRVQPMIEYLERDERFYGPLIVAVTGGNPTFIPVEVAEYQGLVDPAGMEFGIIRFDGAQTYFVLDGQHRLASLAGAIDGGNEDVKSDSIGILIIVHENTAEGMIQSRRLFTHLNRYAKATSVTENITIDEDDGLAIVTRRLVREHPLLKDRTYFESRGLPARGAQEAITTLETIYRCLETLLRTKYSIDRAWKTIRPDPDVLDDAYSDAKLFWDALVDHFDEFKQVTKGTATPGDWRPADESERGGGHLLFRPIGLEMLAEATADLIEDSTVSFSTPSDVVSGIKKVDWTLNSPPWLGVFFGGGRMLTGRDRRDLGARILRYMVTADWPDEKGLTVDYREMVYADADSEEAQRLKLPARI